MGIGGIDTLLKASPDVYVAEVSIRTCGRHWPRCVYQDADEEDVHTLKELKQWLSQTPGQQFSVFRDRRAAAIWKAVGYMPTNANTMLHIIVDGEKVTVVCEAWCWRW